MPTAPAPVLDTARAPMARASAERPHGDTDIPDAVTCGSCRRSRLFASSTATKTVAVPDTEVVPAVRVLLAGGQRVDARAVQAATAALAAPVRLVDRTLMPDGREAWTFVAL